MARRLAAAVAGILLVAAVAPGVAATTTRIECSTTNQLVGATDGTTTWDGTVMKVRGQTWDLANVSDCDMLTGPVHVVINFDLDVATGLGELWGTDTFSPTAYPGSGFYDHYSGTFAGGMPPFWTGKGVGHGFGKLAGWQLREPLGTVVTDPTVLFKPGS